MKIYETEQHQGEDILANIFVIMWTVEMISLSFIFRNKKADKIIRNVRNALKKLYNVVFYL